MTKARTRRKPLRVGRKVRRLFYKALHAVLPRKVRQPLRNAVKGPAPSPEELAAQREAEAEERRERREALQRAKAAKVAEKEREARAKAESASLQRSEAEDRRARAEAARQAARTERQTQKEAAHREKLQRATGADHQNQPTDEKPETPAAQAESPQSAGGTRADQEEL